MIKEIRIYWAMRPYIKQAKELSKMKFSFNLIVQAGALLVQAGNQLAGIVPVKYQVPVALTVGIIQSVVALLAHFRNPDGTPAQAPYVK